VQGYQSFSFLICPLADLSLARPGRILITDYEETRSRMKPLQDSYAAVLALKWYEVILYVLIATLLYVSFNVLLRITPIRRSVPFS
jgi:hypothetical protein